MATRSATHHIVYGQPKDLHPRYLPTQLDILKYIGYYERELQLQKAILPSFSVIADHVADRILGVWSSFSFPTISKERIMQRLLTLREKRIKLQKAYGQTDMAKWHSEVKMLNDLFDISTCRCFDKAEDKSDFAKIRQSCDCPRERKIPELEWDSYCNIKLGKIVALGGIDKVTTQRNLKSFERQEKRRKTYVSESEIENSPADCSEICESDNELCENFETLSKDEDFQAV